MNVTTNDMRSAIAHMETFNDLQVFELDTMIVHTLINEDNNIRMFSYYLLGEASLLPLSL